MTPETVQTVGATIAAVLLLAAMICAGIRIVRGAGMAVVASGSAAFIDIALGVALVGFLAAVAFAGFIERGSINEEEER
jgi:multisubunit Na+/H+ antiporter MnhF subunit